MYNTRVYFVILHNTGTNGAIIFVYFGEVLVSIAIRVARSLTSIQYSPTFGQILLPYGRRHCSLLKNTVINDKTSVPIYTVLDACYTMVEIAVVPVVEKMKLLDLLMGFSLSNIGANELDIKPIFLLLRNILEAPIEETLFVEIGTVPDSPFVVVPALVVVSFLGFF